MDPISNVDRVVLLLRQRLEERKRALQKSNSAALSPANRRRDTQVGGVRALASLDGVDEKAMRRAFIQTLLADQFGQSLINDAQFQQVVERVTDAIEADPATSRLLSRFLSDLRVRRDIPKSGGTV